MQGEATRGDLRLKFFFGYGLEFKNRPIPGEVKHF